MAATSKTTHTACYLGIVPKVFVRAGNPDSACYYRYCWNVGIQSQSDCRSQVYKPLHSIQKAH